MIAGVGVIGCFAINAVSYIPFILVALWILPRHEPTKARFDRSHPFAGMGAIIRQPHLRGALLTVSTTSLLCGPLITFCPVLIRDAFHGSAGRFSLAIAAFGVGGLLGAVLLLGTDPDRDRRRLSSWCALGYGGVVIAAALDPWFLTLPVLVFVGGLAMTMSNTAANTLIQATAAPELRGQTVSMFMLAIRGGMALGSIATGISISLLGVRAALAIDGLLAVVAQLVIGRVWLRCELPLDRAEARHPSCFSKRSRRNHMNTNTIEDDELLAIDAYWRAANYLTVGQIYLLGESVAPRAAASRAHQAAAARTLGNIAGSEPDVRAPQSDHPRPRSRRRLSRRSRPRRPRDHRQRLSRGHVLRDLSAA